MFYDQENDLDCPTEQQIQEICKEIQKSWTEEERKVRSGMIRRWDGFSWYFPFESWIAPQFLPRYSYRGRKSKERMTNTWKKI